MEETVYWLEDLEAYTHYGFGGGSYSYAGFGGYVILRNRAPDELLVYDNLAAVLTAGAFTDTSVASVALYLSSGFGCPLGDGFGLTLYGD